jgi:hypothetical protein
MGNRVWYICENFKGDENARKGSLFLMFNRIRLFVSMKFIIFGA